MRSWKDELNERIELLDNKITEVKEYVNELSEIKKSVSELNEHLVHIRHMLTRMEINENSVIDSYKQINIIEPLYTILSYINNQQLMSSYPDLMSDARYQKYSKLMECLEVYEILDNHRIIHIGTDADGGYLVVDNFDRYSNKILYAMGVGGDVSFEEDMANRGFQAFMYDHTVDDTPSHHDNFHFFKKGLIGHHDDKQPELLTLEEMLNANGHMEEKDIFFKCDIEGYEIDVLNETPSEILNKFTEVVMELHGLSDYSRLDDIISALEKLNKTHRLIHVHPNNISRVINIGNLAISDCIEVTYVRRADYNCTKISKYTSGGGDFPCSSRYPERLFYYPVKR